MQIEAEKIGRFPLSLSPLTNTWLSVLAYLAVGPDTVTNTAEAIGVSRMQANRVVGDFLRSGYLVAGTRHRYGITPRGRSELARFHAALTIAVAGDEGSNKTGTAA